MLLDFKILGTMSKTQAWGDSNAKLNFIKGNQPLILLILKKIVAISLVKWVYLGTTKNCNQDMWSNSEPCTSPEKQRRGPVFYELGKGRL